MNHEISNLEYRGRLGSLKDFDQRLFAETRIASGFDSIPKDFSRSSAPVRGIGPAVQSIASE